MPKEHVSDFSFFCGFLQMTKWPGCQPDQEIETNKKHNNRKYTNMRENRFETFFYRRSCLMTRPE